MPNPQHTYASDGNYTVTLIATNACGSTTITETVNIITAPTAGFTADVTIGCEPLTVNFSDASSNNTTTWLWTFAGGNPASATVANPVVTYNNPGVYAVTLQVSNAAGTNTASQSAYIVVNPAPTASFTSTQNGATFNFNNTSTNGDTYDWEFGDGAESAMENPSHSYTVSGMYTVTLTVSNDCGIVTSTQQVTVAVSVAPVAAFSADILSGCAPMTVNFTDQSSANPTAWLWIFEGGNPASSTGENPQVLYEMPGTYAVTLTATNGVGENTVTQNAFIVVTNAAPLSTFSTSVNAATVSFTNESIGGSIFDWDFGDGTGSNLENPTHSYPEDGTYEVTLVVTNNCGTDITIETIVIATLPSAGFSMNANSGCAPLDLSFTDESSNNTTAWAWTFPGGTPASSTEQNPVVTYNLPGSYDVTLVVTNAQGSDTEVQTSSITIAVAPTAGFTVSGSGLTIDFNNTSTGGSSYEWDFGDGNTSTVANPSHTYLSAGEYEVELIVTNACGTETIIQTVVIGGAAPSASFSATPTTGCSPMTVNFTDQSTGPATWFWTFDGGIPATSTEQNPTVVYNTPGVYEVSLAVSNPFGSNSLTQVGYIEVGEGPEASFTSTANAGTVVFTNTSTGGTSYAWDFGDGNSSTEENPSHTYAANGEYTVTLSVTNGCGTVTSTETITVMVSSTTLPGSVSSFSYYPNPTDGAFQLDIAAVSTKVLQVQLYDIIGRKMMQEDFDFSSGRLSYRFDWSHLVAGTYVLEVLMGGDVLVVKVVVE
jgi:PKD repeat protein